LFSLGAVLYFMATGHPPFRADGALAVLHRICREEHRPVWQTNKDVPDELSDLIDSLLEKKPGRRPATAADVASRLSTLLSRIQQYGPGRRKFGNLRGRRQRRRVIATAVVAFAGLIASVAVVRFGGRSTAEVQQASTVDRGEVAQHVASESEFATELGVARAAVERSEREAFINSSADDSWQQEVRAIERDLLRIENQFGNSP